jgi:hypothetical protein
MTADLPTDELRRYADQNDQNIRALAREHGVADVLATPTDAETVSALAGGPEKADDEPLADTVERNAANFAALAEALGVRTNRLETSATRGDSEKTADVLLGGEQ